MSPRGRKVFRSSSRIFLGLVGLLVLAIAGVVFLHTNRKGGMNPDPDSSFAFHLGVGEAF
jgi:hypothetical protein